MTYSVYLPLLLSMLLAVASRPVARTLSPRTATPALVSAAVVTAAASTWGLLLLAASLLHEAPPITEKALTGSVVPHEPVPAFVGGLALSALTVGAYRLVASQRLHRSTRLRMQALCHHSGTGDVVVVPSLEPQALAVPGRAGRGGWVVVTAGMLSVLDSGERAVLLAHERAHLQGRHHVQRALVDAAAALNPLLRPTRDAVAFLLERCADEAAAETVGSRSLAARSLARAALATAAWPLEGSLAYERLAVTRRVAALQVSPPPPRPFTAAAVALLGLAAAAAAVDATVSFMHMIERILPGL